MTMENRITKISERWFLTEPLLFAAFCSHEPVANKSLKIPFRTGKRRIEYNPDILESFPERLLEEYLKVEMFRILLKHPYQRQPTFPNLTVLAYASNITIADCYPVAPELPGVGQWPLPANLCFEEYYAKVFAILCNMDGIDGNGEGKNGDDMHGKDGIAGDGDGNGGGENTPNKSDEDDNAGRGGKNTGNEDKYPIDSKDGNGGGKNGDDLSGGRMHGKDGIAGDGDGNGESENTPNKPDEDDNAGGGGKNTGNEDKDSIDSKDGGGGGKNGDDLSGGREAGTEKSELEQVAELWEEDQETESSVNELIEIAESCDTWGTIDGKIKGLIKASLKIDMDYRKMLRHFKTSIISNKRRLTRMKPNRRFGFLQMGSRYETATNLLLAVDVSGSVTDKSLSRFFSVINRFFKYGIEKTDVIQFDHELKSETPVEFKKAKKTIEITGRGGTSFQPAADYYCSHPEYDGLIYFTDGYAPPPVFNTKRVIDVLWVLTGKGEYDRHRQWIGQIKRNRATYIPLPE